MARREYGNVTVDRRKSAGRRFGENVDLTTDGYHRIREFIVHGRLAPGTRIIESDLAQRLGLSRTPVRVALDRLRQEGYVTGAEEGRRGRLTVAPLTQDDAIELLNIVGEVEGLAAAYAAGNERVRPALVKELEQRNTDLADAANQTPLKGTVYYELDLAFHQAYVTAAQRPRVQSLFAAVRPQAERYIRMYTTALVDDILTSVREHEWIIQQIEKGDQDGAQQAVRANYRCAGQRLAHVIGAVGERGSW